MVLIGNNNSSLSIETFHKNRCKEKAEVKNITVQPPVKEQEKKNKTNDLKTPANNK